MAWTDPAVWNVGDVLTNTRLNDQIRGNLLALKDPPTDDFTTTADYSTTSTSFVDVNATDFSLDITPSGTEVWVMGRLNCNGGGNIFFDLTKDGVSVSGGETNGLVFVLGGQNVCIGLIYRLTGLIPNTAINIRLQWRVSAATLNLLGAAVDSYFAVREMS